jgi:hypothetical protein
MAQRTAAKARPKNCPACIDPKPIESEQVFSFGESTYRFDGCDTHADQFLSDMFKWARMSNLVERGDGATVRRVASAPARPRRSGKLAYSVLPELPMHVVPAPAEDEIAETEPSVARPRFDPSLPVNHDRWTFRKHAEQRMTERGITEGEALWCAEHPDVTRPSIRRPDCLVRKRGSIQVVVNPKTFEILTVWHSRMDSDTNMDQELELRNAS